MLLLWFPWNLKKIENHGFYNTGEITNHNVTIGNTSKGGCLTFHGSEWLRMKLPIGSMNNTITVSFWAHWGELTKAHTIICSRTTVGGATSLFLLSSKKLRWDNGGSSNTEFTDMPEAVHTAGSWNHYTIVQDGSNCLLYINGELIQTVTKSPSTGAAQYLSIGASMVSDGATPSDNWLRGYIGDLRIYNEALSADRIAKLAAGALSAPPLQNHKQLELWMPLRSNVNNYSINNITATPTAITYAAGRTGQNAVFNGSSSVIKTDFAWRPTTGWTIAGWLKPTDNDGIVIRSNTKYSPWISIQDSTSIQFGHWYTTDDFYRLTYLTTADILNKWLHYCSTWDGSTLRLYVNGELKDSMPAPREPYVTGNMEIGYCDAVPSVGYYKGQMADLRLYNYALSESEIYELSLARVGHWMLNGMQMTTGDKTEYDGEQGKKGTANNTLQGRKNATSPRYQNCFMANGSYIALPSVPYSGVTDEFSYSYWAYVPVWDSSAFGSGSYVAIFNCVESGGWGGQWIKSSGQIANIFHNGSYVTISLTDPWTSWAPGWHMITFTTDRTTTCIYKDDQLIASNTASSPWSTISQKNTPFIGNECSGSQPYANGHFKGNISDIELFAKALTVEDVAKRYQKAHIPI